MDISLTLGITTEMGSLSASLGPGEDSPLRRQDGLTREEFEPLYREHYRVLWCVAAAILGRRADADDCVQDAAMIALGQLDRFERGTNFGAWMSQIVRFTALNIRRREHRRDALAIGPSEEGGVEPGVTGGADESSPVSSAGSILSDQSSFDDALVQALHTLEETPRICLLLRVVLGLPYRAISQQLGIPDGTAMSHVHRSRKVLREALAEIRGGEQ